MKQLKICKYCGKEFYPSSSNQKYCKGPHYMECPVCGKTYEVTYVDKLSKPPTACSYKCRTVLRTQTSLARYGCTAPGNNPEARKKAAETLTNKLGVPYAMMSESVREKSKQTLIEKYGVDNPQKNKDINCKTQKTQREQNGGVLAFNTEQSYAHRKATVDEKYGGEPFANKTIRQKIKATMIERYGAEYPYQIPEIRKRGQETLFQHYGVYNPFSSNEIRAKSEQTMLERYEVSNASYSEELVRKADQTQLERYGKCARMSKINNEFGQFLEKHSIKFNTEKFVAGKWFDFELTDQPIVIEINPTYTHNSHGNHWGTPLPFDYHIAKTHLAEEYGYNCIHVFDWDRWDKLLSFITPQVEVSLDDCIMLNLYPDITNEFLENYDYRGGCTGKTCSLGLLYDNELIQVMVFGIPEHTTQHSIELLRCSSKPGYIVKNGYTHMFHFATHRMELSDIVTFCDLSKYSIEFFTQLGMNLEIVSKPNKWWSYDQEVISDSKLQRCGYSKLFNASTELSNEEAMISKYWLPVYDCGTAILTYS